VATPFSQQKDPNNQSLLRGLCRRDVELSGGCDKGKPGELERPNERNQGKPWESDRGETRGIIEIE
jgi:hypothetical protein